MGLDISGYLRSEETNYGYKNNNHGKYRWETDIKRTCIWTERNDGRLMSWLLDAEVIKENQIAYGRTSFWDTEITKINRTKYRY